MRRVIWAAAILILVAISFGFGRLNGATHSLPAIVATIPGDEAGFNQEFNNRLRSRFPPGSSEDALIDYLKSENFAPEWRRRDAVNSSALILNGLICQKVIRAQWRADAAGALVEVTGAYQSHCL
jgi:hypothetical protein